MKTTKLNKGKKTKSEEVVIMNCPVTSKKLSKFCRDIGKQSKADTITMVLDETPVNLGRREAQAILNCLLGHDYNGHHVLAIALDNALATQ